MTIAGLLSLGACSSDKTSGAPDGGTGGTSAGGSGVSGGGGNSTGGGGGSINSAGNTGSGGSSGGGAGGTVSVTCRGDVCRPLFGVACCTVEGTGQADAGSLAVAGREAGKCGVNLGQYSDAIAGICLQLNQPGKVDSECPDIPGAGAIPAEKGCCTDQGFCGGYEPNLPLGCSYAGGKVGKPCGATDAGTRDSGD